MFAEARPERRNSGRFQLEQEVYYRVLGRSAGNSEGYGKTLDMSSGGILFTTSEPLTLGNHIEVSVSWPAKLDNTALKLVARGRVVRSDADKVAVTIDKYEFHTRRANAAGIAS